MIEADEETYLQTANRIATHYMRIWDDYSSLRSDQMIKKTCMQNGTELFNEEACPLPVRVQIIRVEMLPVLAP